MSDEPNTDATPEPEAGPPPESGAEPEPPCCGVSLESCCGADLDAEDLALLSLGAGLATCAFATFGFMTWTHLLALPCGLVALGCGYRALKDDTPREHAALFGLGTGALGLAMWIVTSAWGHVMAVVGR